MKRITFPPFPRPARLVCAAGALAASLALAGCGSGAPLFLSDGRPTTEVQCTPGSDACEQQARAACPNGYDSVRETEAGGVRKLLYACKAR